MLYGINSWKYDINLKPLCLNYLLFVSFTLIYYKTLGLFCDYLVIRKKISKFVMQKCVYGRIKCSTCCFMITPADVMSVTGTYVKKRFVDACVLSQNLGHSGRI